MKYKLKRPILDLQGKEMTELTIREEINAPDYIGMKATDTLEALLEPVLALTGLVKQQYATMHPADYIAIAGIVGELLEIKTPTKKR